MFRTQVYLSDQAKKSLDFISHKTGDSQSSLIRKAIDTLIASYTDDEKKLLAGFGSWKDNDFDYRKVRRESDRDFS